MRPKGIEGIIPRHMDPPDRDVPLRAAGETPLLHVIAPSRRRSGMVWGPSRAGTRDVGGPRQMRGQREEIMIKLVAMYGKPHDPAHFDRYYREIHVRLAKKIPGLKRFTIHKALGSPQPGEPPYYCLTEVYWNDLETARKALASPDGQASYNDVPNYATGGVTFVFTEIDEVPLRKAAAARPRAAARRKKPAGPKRAAARRSARRRGR